MFKIALNAGHYKYTPGKRCLKSIDPAETREWTLNGRICDKIEKLLLKYDGAEVLRIDDPTGAKNLTLTQRTGKANAWGADFYLAIHHNAGANGGEGGGIVTYIYTKASEVSAQWQQLLYKKLIAATGLSGNRTSPLLKKNYHEVRETDMPAVLLEMGFMDSVTDVPIILTEEYADKCAAAITEAVAEKVGLTAKTQAAAFTPYTVRVTADSLHIRAGAGTNTEVVGSIKDKGVYTIAAEAEGAGALLWGKLISGVGWISLDYTKKL